MRGMLLGTLCLIGCAQEPPPPQAPAPRPVFPSSPSHEEFVAERAKVQAEMEKLKADQARLATQSRETEIRQNPQVPEWGATPTEAKAICSKQGGQFRQVVSKGKLSCVVGDTEWPIFTAHFSNERIDRLDTYLEGADATKLRDHLVERSGAYEIEDVAEGFRVWDWPSKGFYVTSYERGTRFVMLPLPKQP